MEEKIYTIVKEGKPVGPFSLAELKTLGVKKDDFIRKPGMDDYKEAHEFPEIRELLGFSKQYTPPQYFAGFDLRLLADAIDWFIIFGMAILLELIFVLILGFGQKETILMFTSGVILLPLLKFIYHLYMESQRQATIGKALLNIKVTNLQGLPPSFQEVLVRNLSKTISTALFFFGYFYLFLNKQQQCLHDKMANTLVIKDRLI
ncbi:MAG: RDD family protein [Sphingobacteriales bacterium]|nr:RDD family protein [Sphingobacteriales bacterium]